MSGSKKKTTERKAILTAMRTPPAGGYYVWNGKSEEDRPLSSQEMQQGTVTRRRGRPVGSTKESTTIRFDREVIEAFRADGPGWQGRINAALKDWLSHHHS